jgi:hypothetical protein
MKLRSRRREALALPNQNSGRPIADSAQSFPTLGDDLECKYVDLKRFLIPSLTQYFSDVETPKTEPTQL